MIPIQKRLLILGMLIKFSADDILKFISDITMFFFFLCFFFFFFFFFFFLLFLFLFIFFQKTDFDIPCKFLRSLFCGEN